MYMTQLKDLIGLFCQNTHLHISVADVSGIISQEPLRLPEEYRVHSKIFCDMAKSTGKGFEMCMRCKTVCNEYARHSGREFAGLCAFGLYEICRPVFSGGELLCIIYIGNLVKNADASREKLRKAANIAKSDFDAMYSVMKDLSMPYTDSQCRIIAEIIENFIKSHAKTPLSQRNSLHWAVRIAKDCVASDYSKPLTLSLIARTYFINEKYLGRIFKEQIGKSFHEYLLDYRLSKAQSLLSSSDLSCAQISELCGFCSPSYFCNSYKKYFGKNAGNTKENAKKNESTRFSP